MNITDKELNRIRIQEYNRGATEERREGKAWLKRMWLHRNGLNAHWALQQYRHFITGRIRRSRKARGGIIGLKRNSKALK